MMRGHGPKADSESGFNQRQAIEIRIRAERQVGKLLRQMNKNVGGQSSKNLLHGVTGSNEEKKH